MMNTTRASLSSLCTCIVLASVASAMLVAIPQRAEAREPKPTEATGEAVEEKSSDSSEKEHVNEEVVEEPNVVDVLATTENALPSPSMNELLAQGGGVPVGETVEADLSGSGGEAGRSGSGALALGFGLFLMGGGLGAGVMVARQKKKGGAGAMMPAHHLKHVKSIRLSPKHQISLIEAQGKQLVVGVTSAQITLLASLDDPAEDLLEDRLRGARLDADVLEESSSSRATTQDWNDLFTHALKQRDAHIATNVRNPEQARKPVVEAAPPAAPVEEPIMAARAPVVTSTMTLQPEHVAPPVVAEEQPAIVRETEDYTLEEAADEEEPGVARHDGIFAAHDDATAQQEEVAPRAPARARRSRESDSMLIALAAMREEVSR